MNNHQNGPNWAGYFVDGTFDGAYASWKVQRSAGTSQSQDDTWVGVGGDNDDCLNNSECGLIQLGTEMLTNNGYRTWFEFLCDNLCDYTSKQYQAHFGSYSGVNFTYANGVTTGDQVNSLVYWTPGGGSACFNLSNATENKGSFSGCVTGTKLGSVPYDRKSIEWIDENHIGAGNYLADFGKTYFTQESSYNATTGAQTPFAEYGYTATVMTQPATSTEVPPCSNTQILAYPENASTANGGSSDNVWCRQGTLGS